MIKIIIAVSLIFLSGGAWLSLDYLNKQEKTHAKEMHLEIEQARLEAQRRAQTQANFASLIRTNQSICETAAVKAQKDYMELMLKVIPSKRQKQPSIPQAIADEAAAIMASATAECQNISTVQLQKGM